MKKAFLALFLTCIMCLNSNSLAFAATQTGDSGGSLVCWTQTYTFPRYDLGVVTWEIGNPLLFAYVYDRPVRSAVFCAPAQGQNQIACTSLDVLYERVTVDQFNGVTREGIVASKWVCNNTGTVHFWR